MNGTEFAALIVAAIGALAASGIFLIGAWQLMRAPHWRSYVARARDLITGSAYPRTLGRASHNPVLPPSPHPWEAAAVLNPAAVDDGERVHLFYRAIGADGVSRIGYASSTDGLHFGDRVPYPVFVHQVLPNRARMARQYSPQMYGSGGSWGGAEDPRAVAIDGRVYLTYNAFEGWHSLRTAFTTIDVGDMQKKRWNFTAPTYFTPAGTRNKNFVLFPEKVNEKFAIMHNLHGDENRVRIEYVDNLDALDEVSFEGPDPNALPDRPQEWHTRMRSVGPPPIKTPDGWLVLYHAHDNDKSRYKLGAMLLDLNDPTRIVARASQPVLEPEAQYENSGAKPGIVYACGAVVRDGMLIVYYGGADNVVCAAAAPLDDFLKLLKTGKAPKLSASGLPVIPRLPTAFNKAPALV